MWCYQKPGFETLLLKELQRQQQCSQFCDVLLKAEGVSIPAHSCVLSAVSPHISSALSSTAMPPEGQSHLLEFRALGACTLLHLVRLLYSGEMAGEGEGEKQQAISAAAKLGIHGLVEVTKREGKSRDGVGQCAEVGVQTELPVSEREVRDGSTFLWREVMSDGGKDMWTQTEELQINVASPAQAAASFETIDMSAFQSIRHTDSLLVPPQIVPLSFIYPPNENQTSQLSSTPVVSMPEAASTSVAVVAQPYTSVSTSQPHFSSQTTLCAADPQNGWASRDVTVAEECEDEQFERFQGNIPGFISYFLNPEKEEGSRRGRAGRRRGAGVGGARRAGTGERRARRPRARAGGRGRGRGGLTQMVREVGVSRLQKLFLLRWGMRTPRTGQGGGAIGRKLCLKNRELLKSGTRCERRRGRGKTWQLSQGGDVLQCGEVGGSTPQRGRKNTAQQFDQGSRPAGRARRSRAKTATSASFSSPPMHFSNAPALSSSSLSFQASPCPNLLSPAVSYTSPASSFLTPAPPPHEDQPEHIDRLLEEVIMGLDILPKNDCKAPHAQHPLQADGDSGAFASSGRISNLDKPQGLISEVAAVVGGADCASSATGEVPVLEQQCEGELSDMLDNFLQSFEQHIESCHAREEREMSGVSSTETSRTYTVLNTSENNNDQTTTPHMARLQKSARRVRPCQTPELHSDENESPQTCSQSHEAPARCAVSPKQTEEARPTKRQNRRRPKQYLFSLEKKRVRVKKTMSSDDGVSKIAHVKKGKQLQQTPVVKLERRALLPVSVGLQRHICQSLEGKGPAKTKARSSTVKNPHVGFLKTYPIRSRNREAQIMDASPFLEESLIDKQPPSAGQSGRRRRGTPGKNDLSSSNRERSPPPTQAQPVDICGTDEQLENQERHEEESAVQPREEAEGPLRRGRKRGADSDEDTSDDATGTKRACFETTQPPSSEPADFISEPTTTNLEEVIDVETVSLTSVGGFLQEEEEEKPLGRELRLAEGSLADEETQSSTDELIDVDGDYEDMKTQEEVHCQSRTVPALFADLQPSVSPSRSARESWDEVKDEDIDVIGGSSPVPEPVTISWTESSEGEEEEGDGDVDVVGENRDSTSSVIFTAVSKYSVQTEVILH